MAEIIIAAGTPHTPLLAVEPEGWTLPDKEVTVKGGAVSTKFPPPSRSSTDLHFRDRKWSHADLAELRKDEDLIRFVNPAHHRDTFDRSFVAMDRVRADIEAANPDVMVIVGDDHFEWFAFGASPALSIFNGERLINYALSDEELAGGVGAHNTPMRLANQIVNRPKVDTLYPVMPEFATHLLQEVINEHFDPAEIPMQPVDPDGKPIHIPYAFTFVQRRVLNDKLIPMVPVCVNSYFPPITPPIKRCWEFGLALGRAIRSYPEDLKVCVFAAGGMSHMVCDYEMDTRILGSIARKDAHAISTEPDELFRSGHSEIKEWITVAGIMQETDLNFELYDYVTAVRSEAGVGQGLAYGVWK